MLLGAVAGHDPRDSTSIHTAVPDYAAALDQRSADLSGLTIGIPEEYFAQGLEPDVEVAVQAAIETLRGLGAKTVSVRLPHTEYAMAVYYLVATAEASSNLGRYDGVRYGLREGGDGGLRDMYGLTREVGFGPEVKRRIMLGTYALSAGYYDAYYVKAMKVRTLVRQDFDEAFQHCDVLVAPTSPGTAFEVGSRTDDPLKMYLVRRADDLGESGRLTGLIRALWP